MAQGFFSKTQIDKLVSKLKGMVKKADAKYEVTVGMLKRSARCKASLSSDACLLLHHSQARQDNSLG
jgi:predicted RNase H-related nuclease YkuK (DUF458 family)